MTVVVTRFYFQFYTPFFSSQRCGVGSAGMSSSCTILARFNIDCYSWNERCALLVGFLLASNLRAVLSVSGSLRYEERKDLPARRRCFTLWSFRILSYVRQCHFLPRLQFGKTIEYFCLHTAPRSVFSVEIRRHIRV